MECFRAMGHFTGWYFHGPRSAGGTVQCNNHGMKCTGVFRGQHQTGTQTYEMAFDAAKSSVRKWRLAWNVGTVSVSFGKSIEEG